jgi:hypothetical protein
MDPVLFIDALQGSQLRAAATKHRHLKTGVGAENPTQTSCHIRNIFYKIYKFNYALIRLFARWRSGHFWNQIDCLSSGNREGIGARLRPAGTPSMERRLFRSSLKTLENLPSHVGNLRIFLIDAMIAASPGRQRADGISQHFPGKAFAQSNRCSNEQP